MAKRFVNDSVHWYMNELTSRIVAESGIPSDRFHLGKIILQSLKDDPDLVLQTDGATDKSETSGSLLQRSVRCASSFRNLGLGKGDVMIIMAPNHLDLAVPLYAALYLGISIAGVDRTLGLKELQATFSVDQPKIIFCQSEKALDVQIALNELDINADIITFDKGDNVFSFGEFMQKYADDTTVEDFRPADFDPEDTIAFLVATSGTTGLPKAAAATHKNIVVTSPYLWSRYRTFPGPTRLALVGSPLQWMTAIKGYVISTIMRYPRLTTSETLTQEHAYHLINTYKPSYMIITPPLMTTLMRPGDREQCDFTCFNLIMMAGSAVPSGLTEDIKAVSPKTEVVDIYGMSELTNIGFHSGDSPPGSCGKPMGCYQYRGYYNNPEATKEAFAEDRWFKTGDMFYRDENYNYFFVERFKLLLKYKNYQISPAEVETVIRQHPGVLDVAVTGIPDKECGDLAVACIVPRAGQKPSAQEIKDLVKETLSDAKQLRGGVIFMKEIPMTASTKVHRRKLKEMALTMERQ